MSPPLRKPHPDEVLSGTAISRRALLTVSASIAAATAVGIELSRPTFASAAVPWGHPFTFYAGRSRGFTGQWPNGHAGTDYTPGFGTPIHAVADGTITLSGISGSGGAFGESIWIQHADGFRTIYAHMKEGTRVSTGSVVRGQKIGEVGNTGKSYGAHLHIELHINGAAINPDPYINAAPLAGGGSGTPQPTDPTITHRRNNNMASLYYTTVNGTTTFALAGDGVGSAAWLETVDQGLANALANQHGNAAYLTPGSFNQWKSFYLGQA
jgi:hypothetical protein